MCRQTSQPCSGYVHQGVVLVVGGNAELWLLIGVFNRWMASRGCVCDWLVNHTARTLCHTGLSLTSDTVTWTHGHMDTLILGHMDTWSHGHMDPWSHGHMVTWTHGSLVTWTDGQMVTWTHGHMDT